MIKLNFLKNTSIKLKTIILLVIVSISFLLASFFSIFNMQKQCTLALNQLETQINQDFDTQIKEQVESANTMLDGIYQMSVNGEITLDQAKKIGADTLRNMRFGENGYFYADTLEGVNVVLLGNSTEGTNRNDAVDQNGLKYVQEIRKVAMQDGGGYVNLMFPKSGETEASPKRNYALEFEPFGWIVGTGNYVDYVDDIISEKRAELNTQIKSSISSLVIVIAISLLFTLALGIIIIISITKPLNHLSSIAEELAKGNLNADVDDNRKDEIGKLAKSMKNLTIKLKTYIDYINEVSNLLNEMGAGNLHLKFNHTYEGEFAKLKDSLSKTALLLNDTLEQINVASEQVVSGAEQVSLGAQSLSEGATEQASSIEELCATIHEISSGIDSTAKNAYNMKSLSSDVNSAIQTSKESMEQLSNAMDDIKQKSENIENIINTIENIAFQTNILALNASIEAARAGTAGKGFAVVADEVRNLAQKTAEAAKNTNELILNTLEAVNNGSTFTEKTSENLDMVVEKTKQVNSLISDIAISSAQQSSGTSQLLIGADQISSVIQTNSATAEESAASSEELSAQAREMMGLVEKFNLINND